VCPHEVSHLLVGHSAGHVARDPRLCLCGIGDALSPGLAEGRSEGDHHALHDTCLDCPGTSPLDDKFLYAALEASSA